MVSKWLQLFQLALKPTFYEFWSLTYVQILDFKDKNGNEVENDLVTDDEGEEEQYDEEDEFIDDVVDDATQKKTKA